MTIDLDHVIVSARDQRASAKRLAEIGRTYEDACDDP